MVMTKGGWIWLDMDDGDDDARHHCPQISSITTPRNTRDSCNNSNNQKSKFSTLSLQCPHYTYNQETQSPKALSRLLYSDPSSTTKLLNLQPLKLLNTLLPIPRLHLRSTQLLALHLLNTLANLLLPRIVHELALLLDEFIVLLEAVFRLGDFLVDVDAALDVEEGGGG